MVDNPIEKHKDKYFEDSWRDYNIDEYVEWVSLLTKRATHRSVLDKALKDLDDAKNYLWMLEQALKENFNG